MQKNSKLSDDDDESNHVDVETQKQEKGDRIDFPADEGDGKHLFYSSICEDLVLRSLCQPV